ncbi:MAG: hypothetical protein DSM106950_38680 [Stigonema ocellatum SAG 48.90 = DSM 106950]|nr:hypothetical protein [Stigonema ocellatum SAG 48.90 = DSM 106950]
MIKQIIAAVTLALPLAIASLPSQASALETIVNPHLDTHRSGVIVAQNHRRGRWVPGHWERTRQGRRWVPGHYERR